MQSDFESAAWADSHHAFSDLIAGWIAKLAYVFQRLQAIEYDAPWEREKVPPQSGHNYGKNVA